MTRRIPARLPAEAPISQQMELFESFFAKDHKDVSRVLGMYDTLPKYSLRRARETSLRLREMTYSRDGSTVRVVIQAAEISDGKGGSVATFPGYREEMVERVLRYMAAQQIAGLSLHRDHEQEVVVLATSYSAIRKQLAAVGYDISLPRLKESLRVCERAALEVSVTSPDGQVIEYRGPFLVRLKERRAAGDEQDAATLRLMVHPLAGEAIIRGDHYAISHPWVCELTDPLARWMVTLLTERFRGAAKFRLSDSVAGKTPASYSLSLDTVLSRSGLDLDKAKSVERVRQALAELYVHGFLGDAERPASLLVSARSAEMRAERARDVGQVRFGETLTKSAPKTGRPGIESATWKLCPTNLLAEQIIAGNIERKNTQ